MASADDRLAAFVVSDAAALLRFAYLLCGDRSRAEDLVQDATVKLLKRWRSRGPADTPAAYARRVIVNEYLDWRRLRSSGEVPFAALLEHSEPDQTDAQAERDLVWRLILALPPRARAVLVLRYYEQRPDREIAACLNCAEATVRSIAARAFAQLRAHPQLTDLQPEDA